MTGPEIEMRIKICHLCKILSQISRSTKNFFMDCFVALLRSLKTVSWLLGVPDQWSPLWSSPRWLDQLVTWWCLIYMVFTKVTWWQKMVKLPLVTTKVAWSPAHMVIAPLVTNQGEMTRIRPHPGPQHLIARATPLVKSKDKNILHSLFSLHLPERQKEFNDAVNCLFTLQNQL